MDAHAAIRRLSGSADDYRHAGYVEGHGGSATAQRFYLQRNTPCLDSFIWMPRLGQDGAAGGGHSWQECSAWRISLRYTVDVFFGPKATDLPHEPVRGVSSHWMRVPVELLVLACLNCGYLARNAGR